MSLLRQPNAEPIPGYRLIEPLGSGGFGEAWKCEAPGGLFKAIKFVFGNLNSLDMDGARAEQELKALNRVKEVRHPFVLSMDLILVLKGELLIVMELADKSLHDVYTECQSQGLVGIPRETLMGYIRDAAEALDHMNEKHGLQHLDIKPRNLFLVSDRVKIADFGLVKHLERSGASGIMGGVTPLYAPPETFTGTISDKSDQYSLAIVYQEMLTGHRPFSAKNVRQLAQQHMHEAPDLRALPEHERPIVARALEKDPAKRYPNCLAFVKALYTARAAGYVPAPSPSAQGNRPKTMIDTLENFQLEGVPSALEGEALIEVVDLGAMPHLNADGEAISKLGVTVAQPATGALRPTLILGFGASGRRALMELRCRLIDRFGDLDKVPIFRFLYLDTDADAIKYAQRGAAEIAFRQQEVYHLPLQPVAHYRRRQIDQLADWLPREKLYTIGRNLKTGGERALGRLAFTDNYVRFASRLKREIQQACDPDAIYRAVSQTGLALRDSVLRVYVVGSASGGESGYLADLGYTLRRLLKAMNQKEAPLVSMLFTGAPEDPTTPPAEQANMYATLTELNHFNDPAIRFSAQYGIDGPRLADEGLAFDQIYLIGQQHRSPEGRRDSLSHFGSYLFHEITTPLGLRLDASRSRHKSQWPFRSLGTFGVWFPRGLLLRMAARDACTRLLDEWQSGGPTSLTSTEQTLLQAALARVFADPEWQGGALSNRISELSSNQLDGQPIQVLTTLLMQVEEQSRQSVAQDDPGAWARQTLQRVRDWLGSGVSLPGVNAVQQRKSPLTKALESAQSALAKEWDARLGEVLRELMDHGGRRIAIAEAAVTRLMHFCDEQYQAQQQKMQQQATRSGNGQEQLDQALENCMTGASGWSLFGGRSRRLVRVFVDHLAAFSRRCVAEDLSVAVLQFYASLRGRLNDRLRDLGFCRQRLRHIQEILFQSPEEDNEPENVSDTITFSRTTANGLYAPLSSSAATHTPLLCAQTYWQNIRESSTNRVVLPKGDSELEQSARRFLKTLTAEHWLSLDQAVGELVVAPRGGLLKMCMDSSDAVRHFAAPLLNQAISTLSTQLPITDVAQVETEGQGLDERIENYHRQAVPTLAMGCHSGLHRTVMVGAGGKIDSNHGEQPSNHGVPPGGLSLLLIPASEAGKEFGETACDVLGNLQLVKVSGQADLMFCREQAALSPAELERLIAPCRNMYHEHCLVPQTSPHARFDINDWTPLDP